MSPGSFLEEGKLIVIVAFEFTEIAATPGDSSRQYQQFCIRRIFRSELIE